MSEYAAIDMLDQPNDDTWHSAGTPLVVAGWGTLSSGGNTPDKAQHVTVPAVPDNRPPTVHGRCCGDMGAQPSCAPCERGRTTSLFAFHTAASARRALLAPSLALA